METEHTPQPSARLRQLDRLVGTWQLAGDAQGTVRYEWLTGGFFLQQQIDMTLFGRPIRALEIIGHLHPFGEASSPEVHSRVYDHEGNTLDYVYELAGDSLTIWGGHKGSSSYFKGICSADGRTIAGAWTYPGGGYQSSMTRLG